MAKVEIDETELMRLQNVTAVVNKMLANPESRRKVLEAHKTVNPQAVVPELDAAEPFKIETKAISDKLAALEKKIDDEKTASEAKSAKDAFDNKWMSGRRSAQDAGYTEDGLKKLEEFMVENGVADHKVAMPAFERSNPLPAPVASSRTGFDAFQAISDTGEEMKKLLESQGQDNGVVQNLINKTLADVRQR